ncbi:MAG: bifunctional serine/threonine-protein kinase/formylglycine-generating enzyme family protein [Deltaproteobacteria bacterium]
MTLRPEDRALAALLIERQAVPFDMVLAAMNAASTSDRGLGDCLVDAGALDEDALDDYREVLESGVAVDQTPVDQLLQPYDPSKTLPSPRADAFEDHEDTWFDLPRQEVIGPATERPTDPSPPTDAPISDLYVDDEETIPPPAPRVPEPGPSPEVWDGSGPTRAYPPGRISEDGRVVEVIDPGTLDPTKRLPSDIGKLVNASIPATTKPSPPADTPWSDPEATAMPNVRHDPVVAALADAAVDVEVVRAAEPLAPTGKRVDERYQLYGEIGRGGMGRILKARDTDIGREVAVKILLGGRDAPENLIRRFWTEVQATGQLEHPSIIPIHDVGRLPSGELFYVMKKLGGITLLDILNAIHEGDAAKKEEFSRVRLLTIYQQIAYAVAFAHAHGVIHRDIKPANIMVGQYGEAILIDWGLAKIIGGDDPLESQDRRVELVGQFSATETASGTITGTPQYMSPEATEGRPELLTTKSDVYGLGAVLYEILTLEPAYPDIGFVPTVMKVRQADFMPPRQRAPHLSISLELEELVLSAMARQPIDRPDAKELADEIGRILEGAKERERREQEARARVRKGRRSTERWKQLKVDLQAAEAEAKRLAKEVPAWADVEKKAPIWSLEDRVSELKIEAVSSFEEAEADFLRALGEVPDDREARSALSSLYFARFGEAERARDVEGMRYYRSLVSRYDDGVWERVLEGDGTLTVDTDPSGVRVSIARMETVQRVMRPGPLRALGTTPIGRFEIPIGSYLLVFHRDGERDVLRPVLIGRTESVYVKVKVRSSAEIGDAFVLVPEGRAILGGDSVAHGALERHVDELAEYAIARFPVTCDEYLEFLDALAKEDLAAAKQHVPRARAQEGHYWRWEASEGRFVYPERTPGGHEWIGSLPVNGVSFSDARAFVHWKSAQTGEQLRLPTESEWEKAARGVDGRFFPWGDHFDPTFCKMKESRNAPYPEPEPVGTFPTDCSPYGARDMAGGIRELCTAEVGGRTVPVMRGGCWSDTGLFCRVAFRHVTQPDFVNTGLGFRLAKDLKP